MSPDDPLGLFDAEEGEFDFSLDDADEGEVGNHSFSIRNVDCQDTHFDPSNALASVQAAMNDDDGVVAEPSLEERLIQMDFSNGRIEHDNSNLDAEDDAQHSIIAIDYDEEVDAGWAFSGDEDNLDIDEHELEECQQEPEQPPPPIVNLHSDHEHATPSPAMKFPIHVTTGMLDTPYAPHDQPALNNSKPAKQEPNTFVIRSAQELQQMHDNLSALHSQLTEERRRLHQTAADLVKNVC